MPATLARKTAGPLPAAALLSATGNDYRVALGALAAPGLAAGALYAVSPQAVAIYAIAVEAAAFVMLRRALGKAEFTRPRKAR